MTTAEFIAKENTAGVVAFAKKNGIELPNDPQYAYDFLRQNWDRDPEAIKEAMSELHPHANFLGLDSMGYNNSAPRKKYRNFSAGQFDDMDSDAMSIMERGINKGKEIASSLLNGNNQNNNNGPVKDHTKEILTYGAVLLAGIFIGKFLMK